MQRREIQWDKSTGYNSRYSQDKVAIHDNFFIVHTYVPSKNPGGLHVAKQQKAEMYSYPYLSCMFPRLITIGCQVPWLTLQSVKFHDLLHRVSSSMTYSIECQVPWLTLFVQKPGKNKNFLLLCATCLNIIYNEIFIAQFIVQLIVQFIVLLIA